MRSNQAGPETLDATRPSANSDATVGDKSRARVIVGARVLTFDPQLPELIEADILIHGSKIAAVGPDLEVARDPAVERLTGHGRLVMPGLINAHFHSPANLWKGTLDSLPLELFMLYEVPALEQPVSARAAYVRTMLGAVEMLKGGTTSVQDDAFFIPAPSIEEIDAVMSAYGQSGIRATVALDQPNKPPTSRYG